MLHALPIIPTILHLRFLGVSCSGTSSTSACYMTSHHIKINNTSLTFLSSGLLWHSPQACYMPCPSYQQYFTYVSWLWFAVAPPLSVYYIPCSAHQQYFTYVSLKLVALVPQALLCITTPFIRSKSTLLHLRFLAVVSCGTSSTSLPPPLSSSSFSSLIFNSLSVTPEVAASKSRCVCARF